MAVSAIIWAPFTENNPGAPGDVMLAEGESHESAGLGYKHQVDEGCDRQQDKKRQA